MDEILDAARDRDPLVRRYYPAGAGTDRGKPRDSSARQTAAIARSSAPGLTAPSGPDFAYRHAFLATAGTGHQLLTDSSRSTMSECLTAESIPAARGTAGMGGFSMTGRPLRTSRSAALAAGSTWSRLGVHGSADQEIGPCHRRTSRFPRPRGTSSAASSPWTGAAVVIGDVIVPRGRWQLGQSLGRSRA